MHTSTEYTDNRSADRAGFFFDMYKFKSCGILCQQYLAAERIRIKNVNLQSKFRFAFIRTCSILFFVLAY